MYVTIIKYVIYILMALYVFIFTESTASSEFLGKIETLHSILAFDSRVYYVNLPQLKQMP